MVIFVKSAGGRNLWVYDRINGKRIKYFVNNFYPYFYDNNLNKIVCKTPGDVVHLRKRYSKTYEADVIYTTRYLLDRVQVPIKKVPLKICYMDIEVEIGEGSLDTVNTPRMVKIVGLSTDNVFKQLKGNEKEIFTELNRYIIENEIDIITGWNIENYDLEYLKNRAKVIGVPQLPDTFVPFDLYYFYKRITPVKLESYTLDAIAKKELNKKGKLLGGMGNDMNQLEKYNERDVELIVEIDKKLNIIEYYDELRRIVGCSWDDLKYNSSIIDFMLLKKSQVPLPTRVKHKKEEYSGAFVVHPKKGIHSNVVCLDYKSLYPSIMCQFNISDDTKISSFKKGCIKLPNGILFSQEKIGFIINIVKELWEKRSKYKSAEFYNYNKQLAYKFLVNSLYGIFGYPNSRLYDKDIASSITCVGQYIIKWTVELLEKKGYQIIAGDTDSVYVKVKDENDAKNIALLINRKLDEFVSKYGCKKNKYLNIEFEELYDKVIFIDKKKKYVCLKDNNIKFVGFEYVRSDKTKLTKKFQKEAFEKILLNNFSYEQIEKIALSYKKRLSKMDIMDISIPITISKNLNEYSTETSSLKSLKNGVKYLGESMSSRKLRKLYVKKYCNEIAVDINNVHKLKELPINVEKMYNIIFGNTLKLLKSVMREECSLNKWVK